MAEIEISQIQRAVSLVLWEADPLSMRDLGLNNIEYNAEAKHICSAFHGSKLDAEKATSFLLSSFKKWGWSIEHLKFNHWFELGRAISWLYTYQGKWDLPL